MIGIDGDIVAENRIVTDAAYSGTFFGYDDDHIGYQTADGDVTVVTDIAAFGRDLGDHVAASLYDDGLDHVAVPFSHPGESEGTYDFPTAMATTRDTVADHLIANTRFAIRGELGQNPVDHLQVLFEEENPLLDRVEEEMRRVPAYVDETVTALGTDGGPWGGIVYQKEPLDNILHDEVRPDEVVVRPRGDEIVVEDAAGTAVPEAVQDAMGTTVAYDPPAADPEERAADREPLGEGPWDDQIETWTEE